MIAVDTNIVLRLILGDDDRQVAAIRSLAERAALHISLTAMLETGWVLASRYRMTRDDVADALASLLALEGVDIAQSDLVRWAIERYRAGADWADVIHLASSSKSEAFATLDRRLARQAGPNPPVPIETLA